MQTNGGAGGTNGTPPCKPNEYKDFTVPPAHSTAIGQDGTNGTEIYLVPPGPLCSTATKTNSNTDALPRKPNEHLGLAIPVPLVPPDPPQIHVKSENEVGTGDVLARFRFDLVQRDIASGFPGEDLRRVNNIAYRLIMARGFQFEEAIAEAGRWVADNPPRSDEAAFVDVMALIERAKQ